MSTKNFVCFCNWRVSVSVLGACWVRAVILVDKRNGRFCSKFYIYIYPDKPNSVLWNALGGYPWWNHEFNKNPRTDQTSIWFLKFRRLYLTRTDENVQKIHHVTHEDRRPTINGVVMNLTENISSKRPHNWRIFTSSQDANIAGSSLTRTTAWHPFANGTIENLTRQLRDALIAMPKSNGLMRQLLFCWASAVCGSKTCWHHQQKIQMVLDE